MPTTSDTPAASPASVLVAPSEIAVKNNRRCSLRAAGGRPGDRIGLPVITAPQPGLRPITHLPIEVLRRPVESGQFTSWAFGQRLRADGLLPSMGTVGDCYDNSVMESLWGTLQLEVLDSRTWETRAQLANAIFEWIECWYNIKRHHFSLGMLAPVVFETLHPAQTSTLDDH